MIRTLTLFAVLAFLSLGCDRGPAPATGPAKSPTLTKALNDEIPSALRDYNSRSTRPTDESAALAKLDEACPNYLIVTPAQEKQFRNGDFDDAANAKLVKSQESILVDFGYELPIVTKHMIVQHNKSPLKGAPLQLLRQMLDCAVERLKTMSSGKR
jgi:hypothetical protein